MDPGVEYGTPLGGEGPAGKLSQWAWLVSADLVVSKASVEGIVWRAGRPRWREENQGFNVQKNSGLNLEHAYSEKGHFGTYYLLLQIAHVLLQLLEKGSLLRELARVAGKRSAVALLGSLKNIADFFVESLRNLDWPDEVFGKPYVPPMSDGSGQDRALLRKSQQLLDQAGLPIKDGKRLLPNGEVFKIEFLLDEPSFQPHHATFIKNLALVGVEAAIRMIDAVQYRARVEAFDFDVTTNRMNFSPTPGDSLRPYFSSQAAATKGSYNLAGVANPAIDALIEKAIGAETRVDLTNACRALDREIGRAHV